MTKEDFLNLKVGDKIICVRDISYTINVNGYQKSYPTKGVKGIVVGTNNARFFVRLDKNIDGLKDGHFIYVDPYDIELLKLKKPKDSQQEILKVIRSGKATVVIMKDDQGRYIKGVAKCCPEDEYDSIYGLSLAYERALTKKSKKRQKALQNMIGSKNKCG